MATTALTATTDWALAIAGAADVNLQNTHPSAYAQYAVANTTPAAAFRGNILRPFETHPVAVDAGENLYVRTADGLASICAMVATDA